MTGPLELRRAVGWGLVHFFLRLRGMEWDDLPFIARHACWCAAEDAR